MTGSVATTSGVTESNELFVLTLTGKCLDVSGLVNKKRSLDLEVARRGYETAGRIWTWKTNNKQVKEICQGV